MSLRSPMRSHRPHGGSTERAGRQARSRVAESDGARAPCSPRARRRTRRRARRPARPLARGTTLRSAWTPSRSTLRLADAARRVVHDAPEADLVARVHDDLHVREDVLHLLALEELLSAHDAVGDALLAERLLEAPSTARWSGRGRDLARALALFAHEARDLRATQLASTSGVGATTTRTLSPRPRSVKSTLRASRRSRFGDDGVGDREDGARER
jgi:hypothetical protein